LLKWLGFVSLHSSAAVITWLSCRLCFLWMQYKTIKQFVVITSCCNIMLFCRFNAQLWFLSSKTIKQVVVITSCCNIVLFCHVNAQRQFHSFNKLKYTGVLLQDTWRITDWY
jgi:hypothetical protein